MTWIFNTWSCTFGSSWDVRIKRFMRFWILPGFFVVLYHSPVYYAEPITSWWRHQKETFSMLLALCVGNSPVTGEFPAKRPVMFLWSAPWKNGWVNNREAGDLTCHCTHYDIIVMCLLKFNDKGRNQAISSHGIDLNLTKYFDLSTKMLMCLQVIWVKFSKCD